MKISLQNWIILGILALTWGSSFILIKQGLVSFTPYQVGSLRLCFAGGILAIWGIPNLIKLPRKIIPYVALAGFTGNFVPMFLFPIAQTKVSSSMAGILDSLVPLFILLFGATIFKVKGTQNQILGAVIGFVGAVILIGSDGLTGENSFWHCMIIVFATALYGLNSLILTKYLNDIPSFQLSSSLFTIWLLPSILILLFSGFPTEFIGSSEQWQSLGYIAILGLVGTATAMILYYKLIQSTGPIFSSMVTYLMPIVSVFWGFIVGEKITWLHIVGFLLILSGVYLTQKPDKNKIEIQ
ncbi:DMT family transporter [Faecalibacter rhinopitheci]|uniref:DMT family transporter n=1 Tax=Faecalibacter rhinopitheci TaxID=2779678 RepID=A0A8J7FLZ6_9FLAO|nr:DMT family transporter [Faecalibacter rhinopitheci]MBF0596550.1 DMT family transporter [Faecalibacter rhinopitheci]